MRKVCFRCHQEKDISEFHKNKRNTDGYKGTCKACCRLYVDEHIEEKRQYERDHQYKDVINRKAKKYRDNNRDKLAENRKSDSYKEKQRAWRDAHANKIRVAQSQYYECHKDKWKSNPEGRRRRENRRYRNDEEYNLVRKLRSRSYKAMRNLKPEESTMEILGCSFLEFKEYFIGLLKDGMTWDLFLQGKIHEDHIIPVVAFDKNDPIQIKACFYYKNYQPLWGSDNLRKRCTYKEEDKKAYMDWYMANIYPK